MDGDVTNRHIDHSVPIPQVSAIKKSLVSDENQQSFARCWPHIIEDPLPSTGDEEVRCQASVVNKHLIECSHMPFVSCQPDATSKEIRCELYGLCVHMRLCTPCAREHQCAPGAKEHPCALCTHRRPCAAQASDRVRLHASGQIACPASRRNEFDFHSSSSKARKTIHGQLSY